MKKTNITDLVTTLNDLEESNSRLQFLSKLFDKAVKEEFGYSTEALHKKLLKLEAYEGRSSNSAPTWQGKKQEAAQSETSAS